MDTQHLEPSPSELTEEEMEQIQALVQKRQAALETFASEVEQKFSESRSKRTHKEDEWIEARSLVLPDSPALGNRGRDVFAKNETARRKKKFNIVRPKVRIAHSQLVAMQFGAGDKNWMFSLSKSPEPAQEGLEEAMRGMEKEVADQLDRAQYGKEIREAMWDMVTLGTGVVKGPSNCDALKKVWRESYLEDGTVVHIPELVGISVPMPRRVDPWLFFPDPTVPCIDQAEYVIEAKPYTKKDLRKLMSHPKFEHDQLELALEEAPKDWWFTDITDSINTTNYEIFRNKYTVLEYNGVASTDCACAIRPDLDSNGSQMWVQAFVVNGKVIYFDTFDLEAIDSVPYAVGVWEKDPSSVFGFGVPITMSGQQAVVDGVYDVMVENAKVSSGPQIVVNTAMVEPDETGKYDIKPWKTWITNEYGVDVSKVFQQFTPQSNQNDLAAILEMARTFADEESGIPLIQGGLEAPEVGSSATGMALMMKASTSVLNMKSQEWDDQVTRPLIQWMYEWNMSYNQNPAIKGDFEVDVTTPTSMIRKNIELQNLEKLSVELGQNPQLAAEIKPDVLMRARLSGMMLPADNFLKSEEEKAQEQEAMANQPDPAMLELEVKQAQVQVQQEKINLERERLQWESTRGQQRDQWEHEERMANTQARREENQAQLMGKQLEKETELIKMANDQEIAMTDLQQKYNIATMNDETKKVLASMELDIKQRSQRSKELELMLAAQTGSGI